MTNELENWVFLGDSLVEGVGSSRISFVSELVEELRRNKNRFDAKTLSISYIRLREGDFGSFNRFARYNLAGYQDLESYQMGKQLIVWNLASEGTTAEADLKWLMLMNILKPTKIIIFRGSLESIIRPLNYFSGQWPWWVPKSWRGLVTMDRRCYYSETWWRKIKQYSINRLQQIMRHHLLAKYEGRPLHEPETVLQNYQNLLDSIKPLNAQIVVCGLLPVSEQTFPKSAANFRRINDLLKKLSREYNVTFFDWGSNPLVQQNIDSIFYQDGFHPNERGAVLLANLIRDKILFDFSINGKVDRLTSQKSLMNLRGNLR